MITSVSVGFWCRLYFGSFLVLSALARVLSCEHTWDAGNDASSFSHLSHKLTCVLVQLRLRTVTVCFSNGVCCQDSALFLLKSWNFLLIIQSSHSTHICLPIMHIALAMGVYDFLISFSFQRTLFLCDFCCIWGKCRGLKLCPFSNGQASVSVKRPR